MKNFITIKKMHFYHLDFDLKKKLTLLLVFLSLSQVQANIKTVSILTRVEQQQRTISGVVTDKNGETLPGATVSIKGTTVSTTTDFDGKFTLAVNENSKVLVVSFLGFEPKEVLIGNTRAFILICFNNYDYVYLLHNFEYYELSGKFNQGRVS